MGEHKTKLQASKAQANGKDTAKVILTILKYIITAVIGYLGGNAVID